MLLNYNNKVIANISNKILKIIQVLNVKLAAKSRVVLCVTYLKQNDYLP